MTLDEWKNGTIAYRELPNGYHAAVIPLTYDRARIVVARDLSGYYYDGW